MPLALIPEISSTSYLPPPPLPPVFFRCPVSYKVSDENRFTETDVDDIQEKFFGSKETASKSLEMVSFQPFGDTADAVTAATASIEGKVSKSLKSFLKKKLKKVKSAAATSQLAVMDKSLASSLKETGLAQIVHDSKTQGAFFLSRPRLAKRSDQSDVGTSHIARLF